jgi:LysM repeat protein
MLQPKLMRYGAVAVILLGLLMLLPMAVQAAPPMQVDTNSVISMVNSQRTALGMGTLSSNGQLASAAQSHSDAMVSQGFFDHTNPATGSTVGTRVTAAGYSWASVGENIAQGYGSSSALYNGWLNSNGHCMNMFNSGFTQIGVACNGTTCTMVLARPSGTPAPPSVSQTAYCANPSGGGTTGGGTTGGGTTGGGTTGGSTGSTPAEIPLGTDSRLDPQPMEYYAVYCQNDVLDIYHGSGDLLNRVPLGNIVGMDSGGSWGIGRGMTLARSGDTITVSGSNGNRAPASGSRSFSLSACIGSNGRQPAPVTPTGSETEFSAGVTGGGSTPSGDGVTGPAVTITTGTTGTPTGTGLPTGTTPPAGGTYTVQAGDTAFSIALRYGVSLAELGAANGLTDLTRIFTGQRLVIPGAGTVITPVTTTTTTTTTAPDGARTHVIQSGENLFRLSLRYGTTVQALIDANGIVDVRRIPAGTVLIIP